MQVIKEFVDNNSMITHKENLVIYNLIDCAKEDENLLYIFDILLSVTKVSLQTIGIIIKSSKVERK